MMKFTEAQLARAYTLAARINRCEMVNDQDEPAKLQVGILVTDVPIAREAVNAAINAVIASCHADLAAMGIQLAPPEPAMPLKVWAFDPLTGAKHGHLQRHEVGPEIELFVGDGHWQVDRIR
jgi:hypothetical protein